VSSPSVRQAIEQGRQVIGTIVQLPSPEIVEIIGRAGFGYVMLDLEHGPYGPDTARAMVRAADASGISVLWRVPANRPELIMQALDIGAAGVVVPGVKGADDVAAAATSGKFAPEGARGVCSAVRAAGYAAPPDYWARANRETMIIPLIENRAAAEQCDEIVALPGIELILIGPGDLSHSLNVRGQWDHPIMQATITRVMDQARKAGKWVGMYAKTPETARQYLASRVELLLYGIDVQVIYTAFAGVLSSIRWAIRRVRRWARLTSRVTE